MTYYSLLATLRWTRTVANATRMRALAAFAAPVFVACGMNDNPIAVDETLLDDGGHAGVAAGGNRGQGAAGAMAAGGGAGTDGALATGGTAGSAAGGGTAGTTENTGQGGDQTVGGGAGIPGRGGAGNAGAAGTQTSSTGGETAGAPSGGKGGESGAGGDAGSAGSPSACPPRELLCDGECVDPRTDNSHCGASDDCAGANAGEACAENTLCVGGECLSQDASLALLAVTPGTMSPMFGSDELLYSVSLEQGVTEVTVTAIPNEPNATVTVDGEMTSAPAVVPVPTSGLGTIPVLVTAPSGATLAYRVVLVRLGVNQRAYVKTSNPEENDEFGTRVALSRDTLAIAAALEDSAATGVDGDQSDNSAVWAGAVYVFQRTGASWTQQAYLKASNTDQFDDFGCSLALSGDTLAVGACIEDSSASGVDGDQTDNSVGGAGAVYVFQRTGSTWAQQAYIKASNPDEEDYFGSAVALSGDTLAVGAGGEDSAATGVDGDQSDDSATNAGAVYVFQRTGSTWAQQAYLKASNTDAADAFGYSLALSDDTLAVGATGERSAATGVDGDQSDDSAAAAGAVYVFQRTGAVWAQQAYIKASNTGENDQFGKALALSSDTLAVGAPTEDSAATGVDGDQIDDSAYQAGAVYVFQRTGAIWAQQAYIKASNTQAEDQFGRSVALSGDTLAVGASLEDSGATGVDGDQTDQVFATIAGAAYLFRRSGGWTQRAYVKASNTDPYDGFGNAVALAEGTLAVGAPGESSAATGVGGDQTDNAASRAGAVYVFEDVGP